jgi:hypothetical protein
MGRRTLYHPLSLHVIRGALEFCGVKIGRLTQQSSDMSQETATYNADIIHTTRDFRKASIPDLAAEIQNCFAQDVTVSKIFSTYDPKTHKMTLTAVLYVDIHVDTPTERLIESGQAN